jgi:branched-chain amino acid transport system ATP-binding protein
MSSLLEVRDLRAGYDAGEVLHGIRLAVDAGGVTVLLGANGAGKTTTLRAISGMLPVAGKIYFDGSRIDGRPTEEIARIGIAHVPDGRGTFLELSVEENLRIGAYLRRDRSVAADRERVFGYFPALRSRLNQQASTLSGGEQQMLAIARALMSCPKLLLLDEPSFSLAPLVVREIFGLLRRMRAEAGAGILLVEQNVTLALALADRAYLLEAGRIIVAGSADDVARDEKIRRSYLGY